MACTVCGAPVLVERAPKNRYEVRCADCRSALGGLLQGEERAIAEEMWRAKRSTRGKGRYEGLPEFTEEDRAALADMRARKELGNGQVGNRRRRGGGGGGGGGGRRRSEGRKRRSENNDGGGNGGNGGGEEGKSSSGRRRRRRRRRSGGDEGGGQPRSEQSQPQQQAPQPAGE